jgi:hypothetical protein
VCRDRDKHYQALPNTHIERERTEGARGMKERTNIDKVISLKKC